MSQTLGTPWHAIMRSLNRALDHDRRVVSEVELDCPSVRLSVCPSVRLSVRNAHIFLNIFLNSDAKVLKLREHLYTISIQLHTKFQTILFRNEKVTAI